MSSAIATTPGAFHALGIAPAIADAIASRGFEHPTPVQSALLAGSIGSRDVLVSARTGSGKTVAVGLLLAPALTRRASTALVCAPQAMVIAPTRELAAQVSEELAWVLAPIGVRVLAVTGGTSVVGDLRALARGTDVLVGTPGRLLDHLTRGAVDASALRALVLDEADEMLDMGFRDELDAIVAALPAERRTVLLSATIPPEIVALARKYQRDPARIAIDPPGASNEDITHVAHRVRPAERMDVIVNLLLASPGERCLVFVRTRAEAGDMADKLAELGFSAAALTGEMAQRDRTRTLDAFRAGRVMTLVATDVAARGIDVPEISMVIHADPPGDGATLTHRAGRTGRAGRKGKSVLLVPAFARERVNAVVRAASVRLVWNPAPTAREIIRASEERLKTQLDDETTNAKGAPRTHIEFARALLQGRDPATLVAALLERVPWTGPCAPRAVVEPTPIPASPQRSFDRGSARPDARRHHDGPAPRGANVQYATRDSARGNSDRPHAPRSAAANVSHPVRSNGGKPAPRSNRDEATPRNSHAREPQRDAHVLFHVNFGDAEGATPARILAMVCRRGNVRGTDVGGIEIGPHRTTFGVAPVVSAAFARAAARPDRREPKVRIERV